jgi:hypothetical protein
MLVENIIASLGIEEKARVSTLLRKERVSLELIWCRRNPMARN